MKVLVTGAHGMLGEAVVKALDNFSIEAVGRGSDYDISIAQPVRVECDAVINCAGRIPLKHAPTTLVIATNGIGPWSLVRTYADKHVVHVSTDCVFSGQATRPYTIKDLPDPVDLYGRSKLVGEVMCDNATVVRTSFIGMKHGLLRWLFEQHAAGVSSIQGYINAWWTGAHVATVAHALVGIMLSNPTRLQHLSMKDPINKCALLQTIEKEIGMPSKVEPYKSVTTINRALAPTVELPALRNWLPDLLAEVEACSKV